MTDLSAEQLIERRSYGVITQEWLARYAEASGDPNPIHLDEAVARSMGLPGVIAHGMLISGLIHSRAEEALENVDLFREYQVVGSQTRFKSMTHLGDEVSVGGTWSFAESDRIVLHLVATNQRDETVVQAQLSLKRKVGSA